MSLLFFKTFLLDRQSNEGECLLHGYLFSFVNNKTKIVNLFLNIFHDNAGKLIFILTAFFLYSSRTNIDYYGHFSPIIFSAIILQKLS